MKRLLLVFSLLSVLLTHINGQYCGIENPSFEQNLACTTNHSQFGMVKDWENAVSDLLSTPDYFSCGMNGFIASGVEVRNYSMGQDCQNSGFAGFFLNYNDGSQDPRYREYITQEVALVQGRTYELSIDIAKSSHTSSDDLRTDFGIYGSLSGTPMTLTSDYCVLSAGDPAALLASIPRYGISTTPTTFTVTFTPTASPYTQLVLGGTNCGTSATATGYVFFDNVILTDITDEATLTPMITGYNGGNCCMTASTTSFDMEGNTPPTGATILWSQDPGNPESMNFSSTSGTSTTVSTLNPTLVPGNYTFYYSFSKGGCTMTDEISIEISPTLNIPVSLGPDIEMCDNADISSTIGRIAGPLPISPTITELFDNGYIGWRSIIMDDGTELFLGGSESPTTIPVVNWDGLYSDVVPWEDRVLDYYWSMDYLFVCNRSMWGGAGKRYPKCICKRH